MASSRRPSGLTTGGRALWDAVTKAHSLDELQRVQLLEACRLKGRLDEMDAVIQGKGVAELMHFRRMDQYGSGSTEEPIVIEVKFDDVITRANATANQMKQMIAALRLPDAATGAQPQRRGARGAYTPGGDGSALSNIRSIAGGKAV